MNVSTLLLFSRKTPEQTIPPQAKMSEGKSDSPPRVYVQTETGVGNMSDSATGFARPRRSFLILQSSQAVIDKAKIPRVPNTDKATRTAVNAWCSVQLSDLCTEKDSVRNKSEEWLMETMKNRVMSDATEGEPYLSLMYPRRVGEG